MATPAPAGTTTVELLNGAMDVQTLKDAKVGSDGPALVAYFRRQTTTPDQQTRIHGLIRQLGDDSYKARRDASAALAKLGAAAVPNLRRALGDPDEEIKERAEELVKNAADVENRAAVSAAAARLIRLQTPAAVAAFLARLPSPGDAVATAVDALSVADLDRRDADAAAALLAYLPDAESDAVEDEVIASLAALGVHDGKVDAVVAAAIKDPVSSRRAAAAVVLGRSGTAEQRAAVQALLTDPDPRVRFRAAQGLLAGRDRTAVPALIALVQDGPADLASQADELLNCAIGVRAPRIPYGEDSQSRQNCRNAWAAWAKNNKTVDLSRAAVDLPAFNPALRARDVVRQCFNSLVQGDLALFKKTADAPFHMIGEQPYAKRDDLDRFFNENPLGVRNGPFYPLVLGTTRLEEFTQPNPGAVIPPSERAFVAGFKPGELMVFVVQQQQFGQSGPVDPRQGHLFLVRLGGGEPRVIGINQNRQQIEGSVW
jgi:gas vesicle protein